MREFGYLSVQVSIVLGPGIANLLMVGYIGTLFVNLH